jgi:hypothetical protein
MKLIHYIPMVEALRPFNRARTLIALGCALMFLSGPASVQAQKGKPGGGTVQYAYTLRQLDPPDGSTGVGASGGQEGNVEGLALLDAIPESYPAGRNALCHDGAGVVRFVLADVSVAPDETFYWKKVGSQDPVLILLEDHRLQGSSVNNAGQIAGRFFESLTPVN